MFRCERGNMLVILSLITLLLSGVYVMSLSLLARVQVDRDSNVSLISEVYRMESVKSVLTSEIRHVLSEKTLPVTKDTSGYYDEYYMNFDEVVLTGNDFLKIEESVYSLMGDDARDIDLYLSLGSKQVGDFCNTVVEDIYCDTDRSSISGYVIFTVGGYQETFDVNISGLSGGLEEYTKQDFLYSVRDVKVIFTRAKNVQDYYYDGGVKK